MASGINNKAICDTPIAVLDFETTGMMAGSDRVVEVSVVRVQHGRQPELVFDTLVNPMRPIGATEIHGIRNADIADAPTFDEIAGDFVRALSGCVVAAYNVYFDIRFLEYELRQVGLWQLPPHFCLMYMRPLLGLGRRCRLDEACRRHRISLHASHRAAFDAYASARLMQIYFSAMQEQGIATFGDLQRNWPYKFLNSFEKLPFSTALAAGLNRAPLKSRSGFTQSR